MFASVFSLLKNTVVKYFSQYRIIKCLEETISGD